MTDAQRLLANIALYALWAAGGLLGALAGNAIVSHPITWAVGMFIGVLWALWLSWALLGRPRRVPGLWDETDVEVAKWNA